MPGQLLAGCAEDISDLKRLQGHTAHFEARL